MKKKGLIVSSIVMVVVLAVALSTATFAWFSATATAEIQNMTVQTTAASGLEIAAYNHGATADKFTSGTMTLTGNKWLGDTGTSWGNALDMSATAEAAYRFYGASGSGLADGMYTAAVLGAGTTYAAASGGLVSGKAYFTEETCTTAVPNVTDIFADGLALNATTTVDVALNGVKAVSGYDGVTALYTKDTVAAPAYEANGKGAVIGSTPSYMMAATANEDYIMLDFAIHNVSSKQDNIVISKLAITPIANAAGQTGMAAALRVALFASNTEDSYSTTPAAIFNPYSGIMYNTNSQTWVKNTAAHDVMFVSKAGAYTKPNTSTDTLDQKYINKYYDMTKSKEGVPASVTAPDAVTFESVTGNLITIAENIPATGIVYARLVIWFEGEDSECITSFAGGSASVALSFGLAEDFKASV